MLKFKQYLIAFGAALALVACGGGGGDAPTNGGSVTLKSLTVTPASSTVKSGETQQLIVKANYSDGSSTTPTGGVTWISSDLTKARVSDGLVTTLSPGTVTITVGYLVASASADISIQPAPMTGVEIVDASVSFPQPQPTAYAQGNVVQLNLRAKYSDATTSPVTGSWSSSATSVATISSTGLLTTIAPGSTTITSAYGGFTTTKVITVATPRATPLITVTCNPSVPMTISATAWNNAYAADSTNSTKWAVVDPASCSTQTVIKLVYKTTSNAAFGYKVFEANASSNGFYPGSTYSTGYTPQMTAGNFIDVGYSSVGSNIYTTIYQIIIQ